MLTYFINHAHRDYPATFMGKVYYCLPTVASFDLTTVQPFKVHRCILVVLYVFIKCLLMPGLLCAYHKIKVLYGHHMHHLTLLVCVAAISIEILVLTIPKCAHW